jgi:glycosyltransferase involved in cell wall biosynthesis
MKVAIVSTAVPLVNGGGRFIVDWLHEKLTERGHQAEIVYIPYTDELEHILPQMTGIRMMKLDEYFDRVITIRPPAHMIRHPRKVVWFIHHIRIFYDLWQTQYCGVRDNVAGRALRSAIINADNVALDEAHAVFTNSRVVGQRLRQFNGVESQVLYPPILRPEIFESGDYGDEIVSVCRMEHHKRQHLLVQALAHTQTPVRLRLCGTSMSATYVAELQESARALGVADRITMEVRWITEQEKADRLKNALASAYLPYDEDSYGYPTIEAAHAQRCTITVTDSGGVPEFVIDGETGFVTEPTPVAVAAAFDRLYRDRELAGRLGRAANARVFELGIDWDTVISRLLA